MREQIRSVGERAVMWVSACLFEMHQLSLIVADLSLIVADCWQTPPPEEVHQPNLERSASDLQLPSATAAPAAPESCIPESPQGVPRVPLLYSLLTACC